MTTEHKKEDKKVSLFNATFALAALIERADEEQIIKKELIDEIRDLRECATKALDRRKFILNEADVRIEAGKKMINEIKEQIKRIQKTKETIKESTKEAIKMTPKVKYKDSLGKKVGIKSTTPKLKLDLDLKSYSLKNVVPVAYADDPGIRPYIFGKSFYMIDTEKVRADLNAGHVIPWASLIQKETVYGLS